MQLKTLEKQLKDELGVVTDAIPEHATLWETMCTAGLNAYKKMRINSSVLHSDKQKKRKRVSMTVHRRPKPHGRLLQIKGMRCWMEIHGNTRMPERIMRLD